MPSQEPQPGRAMYHCDTRSQGCLSGMYGPDLLFHQQYPTTMCGKVTTRTAPADTVPTVTDWQLNREGTVYRPASGGDGAGWMGWGTHVHAREAALFALCPPVLVSPLYMMFVWLGVALLSRSSPWHRAGKRDRG